MVRGRQLYVYHKNLLDHIGSHSSFTVRAQRPQFPQCFESMASVWSLNTVEKFDVSTLLLLPVLTCCHSTLSFSMMTYWKSSKVDPGYTNKISRCVVDGHHCT